MRILRIRKARVGTNGGARMDAAICFLEALLT